MSLDHTALALAVTIKIPAEAAVPLMIGIGAVLVLMFAGAGLADWKRKHPAPAKITGAVLAGVCTAYALYVLVRIIPEPDMNDKVHEGVYFVTITDAPIAGLVALIGTLMWRFAGQRWIALAVGVGTGAALIVKPFVVPLRHWWDYKAHVWGVMDPEHLGFLGPGVALVIAGLVAGLKRPAA